MVPTRSDAVRKPLHLGHEAVEAQEVQARDHARPEAGTAETGRAVARPSGRVVQGEASEEERRDRMKEKLSELESRVAELEAQVAAIKRKLTEVASDAKEGADAAEKAAKDAKRAKKAARGY